MKRNDGRASDELRAIRFEVGFTRWAEGSVLARFGETHVLCNVTVEERLPQWLRNAEEPHGWLTAEYAMLPRSTHQRMQREQRWPRGRTQEISRLIGRSLRMALDLRLLGARQMVVDCDVLQADGGTRTTAICGSWVAVMLAIQGLIDSGIVPAEVATKQIGAISVGVVDGSPMLDLAYAEDVSADSDLNVVMASDVKGDAAGQWDLVEVQGTAEKRPFSQEQFTALLGMATQGIKSIGHLQEQALYPS